MLTPWDEFLCHQLPTTLDHVFTSDPAWTERVYISLYNVADKDMILGCGVGQYPNKNVQDGFATVWYQGKQYNFRASRTLRPHPHEIKIGPLSIEILEGLKRFHMVLADNPSGMRFDIEWTATMNPHEEEHDFRRSNGRVVQDTARFDQVGRARGTLQIPGTTVALTEDTWWSHHDRSWGMRRPLRTEATDTRRTTFAPFLFENGERRHVSFVTHPPRWHLKGGGYGGYRGWHHGDNKGQYYCEHEVWDLSDPTVLREASTLSDHLIEWRCGDDTGFGVMEYGVGSGYYKYTEVQHLPTF